MVKIDSEVKQLTVREFLSDGQYVIPIYQRNYDWGERETLQLLEDISDYAQKTAIKNTISVRLLYLFEM